MQRLNSAIDNKKTQALRTIKNTADLGCHVRVIDAAIHHIYSISPSRISIKARAVYFTLFLVGGLAGALNIFGMSSSSPSEQQERMLVFSIMGTAILHGSSFVYQIMYALDQREDFKQKTVSGKILCILKQSSTVIPSAYGTLPDGALTFFGLAPRIGSVVVSALCALVNILVETVTYNLLAKDLLYSLNYDLQILCKGIPGEYFDDVLRVVKIIYSTIGETDDDLLAVVENEVDRIAKKVALLDGDRRFQSHVVKVLTYIVDEKVDAAVLIGDDVKKILDCSEARSKALAGIDAVVSIGLCFVIYAYTAEFFSARAFTSHLSLSYNYTAVNVTGQAFSCYHYAEEMHVVWNGIYNAIGYAGAVSAALLSRSIVTLLAKDILKKLGNVYVALCDHSCRDELRVIFVERIVGKLIAAGLAIPIGLCFRGMALANIEHLEIFQRLKECSIKGLNVKLPSIEGAGYVVANGSFLISFILSFTPLFIFLNLVADWIRPCNPLSRRFGKSHMKAPESTHLAPLAVPEESISDESVSDLVIIEDKDSSDSEQRASMNVIFNEMP